MSGDESSEDSELDAFGFVDLENELQLVNEALQSFEETDFETESDEGTDGQTESESEELSSDALSVAALDAGVDIYSSTDYTIDDLVYSDLTEDEFIHSPPSMHSRLEDITTEIIRDRLRVESLRNVLISGEEGRRPGLDCLLANKILDKANYWCAVKKMLQGSCSGGPELDCRFFKLGPIPGRVKKVVLELDSHDQGWSGYPSDRGTRNNSWTWAELDIKDPAGNSRLESARFELFRNLHAIAAWHRYELVLKSDLYPLDRMKPGDTVELYFRAQYAGWRIFIRDPIMEVHFEPCEA